MDFLALVQRTAQESGTELQARIESVAITPATSYGGTTEHINRLVNWVQQSWLEIQNDQQDWNFMREKDTMDLQLGQTSYDIRQDIINTTGNDQFDGLLPFVAPLDHRYIWVVNGNTDPLVKQPCYYIPPEHFLGYRDRDPVSMGQPTVYTVEPTVCAGCIVVDPAPSDAGWYLEFEYRLKPQTLALDADIPTNLPDKFHMLLVYWAMEQYGDFDESENQFKRAKRNRKRMMNKLRLEELREYTMPGTR